MSSDRLWLRGKIWWIWGYDANGKRWQESTRQRDRKAAELTAREIERRYAADPDHRSREKLTVEEALKRVLAFQRSAGRAEATQRATRYHAGHLLGILGRKTPLSLVSLGDTTAYFEKRLAEGAHKHTIAKELHTLTQAMRRCAKLGLIKLDVDPSHFVPDELGKFYAPRERWLTKEEYHALLDDLGASLTHGHRRTSEDRRDYVIAWCHIGMRKTELFDMVPAHYDAVQRELFVDGTKTDGAPRFVPLDADAEEVIARRAARKEPFPVWHTVCRDLDRSCLRLGIPPVTPNDLRRTFCSWLCQAGVAEAMCAKLMGHKSTNMVRAVYGHYDRGSMAAAVSKLSSPPPAAIIDLAARRSLRRTVANT